LNDMPLSMLFGILALMLILSAFFAGSETALMSLNRYRLRHLVKLKHPGAIKAHKLLQRPDHLLGLMLLGNIFINNYRRKAKQKTIFDNTPNDFLINQNQVAVSNGAESEMRLKEIKKAIQQLPEIFKTPFLLYFDGYKYNEISDVLNEPLGTIKSRIHFARKLLKEQISRF